MTVRVRPARASDLQGVYQVWFATVHPGGGAAPHAGPPLVLFRHELTTGQLWVAEDAGGLVGYAASFVRGGVLFLADLFVVPAGQSHGTGAALLDRVLAPEAATHCTMSSLDPRALTLYVRAGMRPRWPHLLVASDAPDLARLPGSDLSAAAAVVGDPEFLAWDARIGGRMRPEDHVFWVEIGAVPLWFTRRGTRVGYGYAWIRTVTGGQEVRIGRSALSRPGMPPPVSAPPCGGPRMPGARSIAARRVSGRHTAWRFPHHTKRSSRCSARGSGSAGRRSSAARGTTYFAIPACTSRSQGRRARRSSDVGATRTEPVRARPPSPCPCWNDMLSLF